MQRQSRDVLLTASSMQSYLGNRNRVYNVLNRKRRLKLPMIRHLNQGLQIPDEVLIAQA